MLKKLLHPQSVVVVGASTNNSKVGGRVLYNIKNFGFKGDLWGINPKEKEIDGCPAFPSIADLPYTPDLAIIATPKPAVKPSLIDLAKSGVKIVVIFTSGYGEIDEAGKVEEQELVKIADDHGIIMLGPNCMGIMSDDFGGSFAGPIENAEWQPGLIDFISGSGGTTLYAREVNWHTGIPCSTKVTVGNSAQTTVEDILEMYDEGFGPASSKVIMLYMEQLKKPAKLLKAARSLAQKGVSIVVVKSGAYPDAKRAAMAHTNAQPLNDVAVGALFKKAGIIRVDSKRALGLVSAVLLMTGRNPGKNACVITESGGPGVMACDELNRKGFNVPVLKTSTQQILKDGLSLGACVGNPVDVLPTYSPEQLKFVLDTLQKEEADNIDFIIPIMGDSKLGDKVWPTWEMLYDEDYNKTFPILPILPPVESRAADMRELRRQGHTYFEDEVDCVRALGKIVQTPMPAAEAEVPAGYDKKAVGEIIDNAKGFLLDADLRKVLTLAGINLGEIKNGCESAKAEIAVTREAPLGPLVRFSLSGPYTEVMQDMSYALGPIGYAEARDMITEIKAYPVWGSNCACCADECLGKMADTLVRLTRLAYDFPAIKALLVSAVSVSKNTVALGKAEIKF